MDTQERFPQEVDLKLLTQIAILVDKYRLHEVVGLFSNKWTADLYEFFTPKVVNDYFLSHLCIFWVFSRKQDFELTILSASQKSSQRINGIGFPIPDNVLGKFLETLGKSFFIHFNQIILRRSAPRPFSLPSETYKI